MLSTQWIDTFLRAEGLPVSFRQMIEQVHAPLAQRIAAEAGRAPEKMRIIGVCGPQGSGKSTLAASLKGLLECKGLKVATLSLDDLYLTRKERTGLAQRVHPLLQTRGVPGTHDVRLGMQLIDSLRKPGPTSLPSFDKSRDDRRPREQSPSVPGPVQVLIFEGWCVGATPQPQAALLTPVNALERDEDPDGIWRRYVNDALAGAYQGFFKLIDMLVLLKVPSLDAVFGWRLEQEQKLRERISAAGGDTSQLMNEAQLKRFISHYQRLTTHIIEEMPARADLVLPVVRAA